jgi:hypothetical protein
MVRVTLPAVIGVELASIMSTRLVEAELVAPRAAVVLLQITAGSTPIIQMARRV